MKMKNTVLTHKLFICEREGEVQNLAHVKGAGVDIRHGETQGVIWFSPTTPEKTFQKRDQGWGT